MIRDTAVDLLMKRLGNRKDAALRDTIISEMVYVQEDMLEQDPTLPWFLVSELADATTTVDDDRVVLPGDFLQEFEDGALYVLDDSGTELELFREDWDYLKQKVTGSGRPRYYDLVGDYIMLRKVPDEQYTLKMRYYKKAASLAGTYGDSANIENKWLEYASALLIAETGVVVAAQHLQSDKMAQLFMKQADLARNQLLRKNTAMAESNKSRLMEG